MPITEAFKAFVKALTGSTPVGTTIHDVIVDGAAKISGKMVMYDADSKSIVLNSSTASSTKKFKITVTDDGTITATEVTE